MPLVEELYYIADGIDHRFECVMTLCQFERTHMNNIHVSEIWK